MFKQSVTKIVAAAARNGTYTGQNPNSIKFSSDMMNSVDVGDGSYFLRNQLLP
jgi:hypothetical protein